MTEHFSFFFVRAMDNGSLFVGPKLSVIENPKEIRKLLEQAHRALKNASIDVSRILADENYGELRFYINNKLEAAIEILHEIDEEF